MRKSILIALFLFCAQAWATCTVSNIYVTSAAPYYNWTSPPTVVITGPGAGGATAYANSSYFAPYWILNSVTVTAGGAYTGPVSVYFSGGSPVSSQANAYAVMTGSCGAGGGATRKSAWLM
jgi:hypothetical protein